MSPTEGEIQVLASISRLEADGRRVDDLALNERGEIIGYSKKIGLEFVNYW